MKINKLRTKFSISVLFIGFCLIILCSCSSRFPSGSIYDAILNKLELNMSIKETENLMNKPSNSIAINQDGLSNYLVLYYYEYHGYFANPVALCFKNDKLVFWGYPHEFAKLDNVELNKVIKIANAEKIRLDSLNNKD